MITLYCVLLSIVGFGLFSLIIDLILTYRQQERNYTAIFYVGWALIAWPTSLILWEIVVTSLDAEPGTEGVGTGAQGIMIGMITLIPGLVLMITGFILRR